MKRPQLKNTLPSSCQSEQEGPTAGLPLSKAAFQTPLSQGCDETRQPWQGAHVASYLLQDLPDLLVESHRDPVEGPIQPPPPLPLALSAILGELVQHLASQATTRLRDRVSGQLRRAGRTAVHPGSPKAGVWLPWEHNGPPQVGTLPLPGTFPYQPPRSAELQTRNKKDSWMDQAARRWAERRASGRLSQNGRIRAVLCC